MSEKLDRARALLAEFQAVELMDEDTPERDAWIDIAQELKSSAWRINDVARWRILNAEQRALFNRIEAAMEASGMKAALDARYKKYDDAFPSRLWFDEDRYQGWMYNTFVLGKTLEESLALIEAQNGDFSAWIASASK